MLSFNEFFIHVKSLKIGKKVGKNVYILWDDLKEESSILSIFLQYLITHKPYIIIKFFTDQYKVSFLHYPDFFTNPHPILKQSETLDLTSGKKRIIDYSNSDNPPILHRKETMIAKQRNEYPIWLNLTKELESYVA